MSNFLRKFLAILQQQQRNLLLHPYQSTPPRQLILLRHGETCWDKDKTFEGWYDTNLTDYGKLQAFCAGRILRHEVKLDYAFSSSLSRANESLCIVLDEMKQCPCIKIDWRLCERHFGELTGFEEEDMRCTAGNQQVDKWLFEYDELPPKISEDNPYYCHILQKFQHVSQIPQAESIKGIKRRVLEFFHEEVSPQLKKGKKVLIVAHDYTLKSIVSYLEEVAEENVGKFAIPRCVPIVYSLDYYLQNIGNFSPRFWGDLRDVRAIADTWGCEAKS